MSREIVLQAVKSAGLGKSIYFTASELLAVAPDGRASISKEEFCELAMVNSWNSARSQLSDLTKAGIIEYSAGVDVTIVFLAFDVIPNGSERSDSDQPCGDSDHGRSEIDHGESKFDEICGILDHLRSEIDQMRSEIDHGRSVSDHAVECNGEGVGIGLVGNIYTPTSEELKPTNPEPQQPQPASFVSLTDDQQAAYDLLTDSEIRMNPKSALDLCQKHTLVWVAQQTATYWQELKDKTVRGPGALVNRLTPGSGFSPSPITDDFRRSEVYRRHNLGALFAEAERAERRAAYASMENYEPQRSSYVVADEYADVVIG